MKMVLKKRLKCSFLLIPILLSLGDASEVQKEVSIEEKIMGLYVAYFNRASDYDGLEFWKERSSVALSKGEDILETLKKLSFDFSKHPLFIATYAHLNNQLFVERIYQNVLGIAGDKEGIGYWRAYLDNGGGRSDMVTFFVNASLLTILNSENFPDLTPQELSDGERRQKLLENKIEVGLSFVSLFKEQSNVENITSLEEDSAYLASIRVLYGIRDDNQSIKERVTLLEEIQGNENPIGEINSRFEAKALSIYNHAYQENYEADTIEGILANAKDAYVLLDPFSDNSFEYVSQIQSQKNQIGGYISVGTGEEWREDFAELKPYLSTKVWSDWEGEYFVNETQTGIIEIMKKRIDKMADWGLDWVEFDNMDWASRENQQSYALAVTSEESKRYVNELCAYTHLKGMKCMAKNVVEGFEYFDGVLYESASNNKNWWNQEGTRDFLKREKLVIINHYNESDCDAVYEEYKSYYNNENISFICEDVATQKYKHYGE